MAPVFVPRAVAEAKAAATQPSFAQVVRCPQHIPYEDDDDDNNDGTGFVTFDDTTAEESGPSTGITYCPHSINGGIHMRIGVENCIYFHGDLCDLCNYFCLDPTDEEQRKTHRTV